MAAQSFATGTEQQFLVSVNINGTDLGVFDTYKGGDVQAKVTKHRPGGMGPEQGYPALPVYTDVTVSRVYDPTVYQEILRTLNAQAGRVPGSVAVQPLDANGNAFGKPIVYGGVFSNLKWGNVDSTSEKPRMFEIDLSVFSVA